VGLPEKAGVRSVGVGWRGRSGFKASADGQRGSRDNRRETGEGGCVGRCDERELIAGAPEKFCWRATNCKWAGRSGFQRSVAVPLAVKMVMKLEGLKPEPNGRPLLVRGNRRGPKSMLVGLANRGTRAGADDAHVLADRVRTEYSFAQSPQDLRGALCKPILRRRAESLMEITDHRLPSSPPTRLLLRADGQCTTRVLLKDFTCKLGAHLATLSADPQAADVRCDKPSSTVDAFFAEGDENIAAGVWVNDAALPTWNRAARAPCQGRPCFAPPCR